VIRGALIVLLGCAAAAAQDYSQITIEKVVTGFQFADGPAWSPREAALYFSDTPQNRVYRVVPSADLTHQIPAALLRGEANGPKGNAVDAQGRIYTCESHTHRIVRTAGKGKIEIVADAFGGKHFNAPNDLVVRKDGHVFFTDPAFSKEAEGRELDYYGVFQVTPKGEVSLIAKPKGRPNGIALGPDGKTLYVADSDNHSVLAYDLDRNGVATGERAVVSHLDGVPDGVCVDGRGDVYVAAKWLYVFDSAGKPLTHLELSEKPSGCTFGDADLKTLYVTARTTLYRVRVP
jgi:sugar lactone lactonase YvrE